MSIETEIFTRLTTFAGLSALIATRAYPNVMPQGVTYPAVTYRRVSATRFPAMGADTGLVRARFQVDSWAVDYAGVRVVAEEVRKALQRWTNPTGTVVQDTFVVNEIDLFEPSVDTDDAGLQHVATDFEIFYEE